MAVPDNPSYEESDPEPVDADAAPSPSAETPAAVPASDPHAMEVEQFLADAMQTAEREEFFRPAGPRSSSGKPPGPGLFESIIWMFGVFGAHFAGIILFLVGAVIYLILTHQLGQDATQIQKQISQFLKIHPLEMAGVEQAIFVFIGLVAVTLRLGKGTLAKLNLQPFAFSTGFLLFLCVLPLSMLSGEFYRIAFDAWSAVAEQFPLLKRFNEMQTMEMVKQMAENSPLWGLVLVIAVFPAIGEEIIFRGVIGRGLLARWGLIPGILITSILFGIVHAHPAHAMAVIPLGIFMHLAYCATRSFWAPILVHFLNNAFAVTMAKMVSELPENAARLGDETQPVHPMILMAAALFMLVVCVYLWKTRVKYVTADGKEWTPGYVSNERPPANSQTTRIRQQVGYAYHASMVFLFFFFLAMMNQFGLQ